MLKASIDFLYGCFIFVMNLKSIYLKLYSMFIYSVSCTMPTEIAPKWEQFFLDKHLDDVVNTGYFTGYSFRKVVGVENTDEVTFVSEYYFNEMSDFENYNKNAASKLKTEVMELFEGKFRATRQILQKMR